MTIAIARDDVLPDLKGYARSEGIDAGVTGTDNVLTFPFRPETITQTHGPQYGSLMPIGMSHDYQPYNGSKALVVGFELWADALALTAREGGLPGGEDLAGAVERMEQARRFLEAHTVPPEPLPTQFGCSPAALLLCLPGVLTMRCRLTALRFTHATCDSRGRLQAWRAATEWTEAPLGRITAEAVLQTGTFRSWGAA